MPTISPLKQQKPKIAVEYNNIGLLLNIDDFEERILSTQNTRIVQYQVPSKSVLYFLISLVVIQSP